VSKMTILSLQALPETQPLNYSGLSDGALAPCTHTCGDSCEITCVRITCRYGWTCASTSMRAAEPETPNWPDVNIGTSTW